MAAMATAMERHIQQTNERLQCIKEALSTPTGFQSAARELLDWCSDHRAFQKVFEQNLIGCLTVVSRVAAQQGFDLDLGYRLLAVCAAQRDKFSPKSAALLSLWCEDLGRLLLLRHQKTRDGDPPKVLTPNMHQSLQKGLTQGDSGMATMSWQQGGQPGPQSGGHGPPPPHGPHQGAQQQLSVVTTVWGVTTSTQSGPLAHNSYGGTTNTTMAQTPYSQSQQGYPGGPTGVSPKSYPPQSMPRQSAPGYNGYGPGGPNTMNPGMGGNMQGAGHATGGEYQAPPSALSAAALVAAATATATATASVVALQERQQQEAISGQYSQMQSMQSQQYPPGYGPQHRMASGPGMNSPVGGHMGGHIGSPMSSMGMPPNAMSNNSMMNNPNSVNAMGQMSSQMSMNGPMGPMGKNPIQGLQGMTGGPHQGSGMYATGAPTVGPQSRSRPSPYQNPNYMKRQNQYNAVSPQQQYAPTMQPYGPGTQAGYSPNPQYPTSQAGQYPKQQQQYAPTMQQQPMPASSYPPQQQMRPNMRSQAPPYTGQPNQYYQQQGQLNGAPPQTQYDSQYVSQYGQPNIQRSMNYQASPIPGNPTPPLTPASGVPPYLSPNPDLKPSFPDVKPPLQPHKDDELRLTFPVRDGIILAPFRLEHNLAVSNHVFHLKQSVHQTLMWRTDLELQLKCFHHEDRQMNTNWPASVQVSVNATPLCIDRGENKTSHKPLYLKDVCQPGRNTIQITVTACCCSHLFLLQLVHRPTVRSVLQGLLRKRLLPAEHCIAKIKRNFTSVAASTNSTLNGEDGVEQTAIKVSLKCPITFKRITLPARGQECKHIQCFDLESYLQLNCERGSWRCPVCNKPALLEGLEVDQYMWGILTNLSISDVEEVTIDATASWKPVPIKSIKEEHDGPDPCNPQKRFKAMSPGSMTMPTTSTWEMGQGLSPYSALPPPDMQSITNGPMANGPPMSNGYGGQGFEFQSQASDFSSPLSHLNESVASLDPLAAMEKSLSHHEQQMNSGGLHDQNSQSLRHPANGTPVGSQSQSSSTHQPGTPAPSSNQGMMQHGPHTPHTPHTPMTPGNSGGGNGPPSVPPPSQTGSDSGSGPITTQPASAGSTDSSLSHAPDLSDLNFDPAAVIEGEGQGQEQLNLLPESVVDPMELLSYLDTPELGTTGSTNATTPSTTNNTAGSVTTTSSSSNDDLLALFES